MTILVLFKFFLAGASHGRRFVRMRRTWSWTADRIWTNADQIRIKDQSGPSWTIVISDLDLLDRWIAGRMEFWIVGLLDCWITESSPRCFLVGYCLWEMN